MDENKKIDITGVNNRYMIKKVMKEPIVIKKRAEITKLNLQSGLNQLSLLDDELDKIVRQQIDKKISGYKQQDVKKGVYEEEKFINFESITSKMRENGLKCYYCKVDMMILYETAREATQWTVDRIDNDIGHNITNYHLACLSCNLKRRRTDDEKFLFTKQLGIIKKL